MLDETSIPQDLAEDYSPADLRQTAFEKPEPANAPGPKRVLPLAIVAVAATLLVADMASHAIWNLSGHRYAAQMISDAL